MPRSPLRRKEPGSNEHRSDGSDRLTLEQFVPYRLSVLANTVSRDVARMYGERFGLSIPEWRVMAVLARYQPLSAVEVARRTAMDKVRVSRAVARLLRAGVVQRSTDRRDRRRSELRLSPRGVAIHGRIVPLALGVERELLSVLGTEERNSLDRLLAKLQARAEEIEGRGRTIVQGRRPD
jgi:DNA-binding MarR family transcriptional regulator